MGGGGLYVDSQSWDILYSTVYPFQLARNVGNNSIEEYTNIWTEYVCGGHTLVYIIMFVTRHYVCILILVCVLIGKYFKCLKGLSHEID